LHCDNVSGQGDRVLRFVLAQLRGRPRRTLALLAGVLVATTGFTVLSASTAVQRLQVEGTVAESARSAYDILVRPKGTRTTMEEQDGLVSPNHLSGTYGGITTRQLEQIGDIGNVEVAAPVAMLGYVKVTFMQTVDLTDQVDPNAQRQLFRFTPKVLADRGLTVLDDAPHYLYLTRNQLVRKKILTMSECEGVEVEAGDRYPQLCWALPFGSTKNDGTTALERTRVTPMWQDRDGRFVDGMMLEDFPESSSDRLTVTLDWSVMVLAAAIDPAAEAELVGLDRTLVSGRYLEPGERAVPKKATAYVSSGTRLPTLYAAASYVDEKVEVSVERLGADSADSIVGKKFEEWVPRIGEVKGTPLDESIGAIDGSRFGSAPQFVDANYFYQVGAPNYQIGSDNVLRPDVVAPDKQAWTIADTYVHYDTPTRLVLEDGFRSMTRKGLRVVPPVPMFERVGTFDPTKLEGFSPLSEVPLETYQAPEATGADDRTRQLLDGKPLRPNSNPAGYLATPPLILTTLDAARDLPAMRGQQAPISAVRVRVRGVTGIDDRSQELVRSAAERIMATTGLDVDITLGSSPKPQTVALPAGPGGRPELVLKENWSRKGAALAIVQASDRKSLVLFGLILLVCTLFLGNAVTAAVRDRRRELAVLTCLGWPARRLAATVLIEVVGVGLIAGVLAGALAMGLADTAGAPITVQHTLVALPVALGITVLAATIPALLAARSQPLTALRPPARVRRARRRTSILAVALGNLWRVPGRTALGVTALAVGVGALTVLVLIALAFRDDVVGTLLGDAVALRVRTVDVLAAITTVCLGVLIVADTLYINIRERATELAALWASGWTNQALFRLVGYEGVGMGALGTLLGSAIGLFGVTWFTGEFHARMVWLTAAIAAAAIAIAGIAAIVPALVLRRLPLSTLLAEE
jgi:putative ABC transport system permease protein